MRQKNLELQRQVQGTKDDGDEGLFNAIAKDKLVTFDYQGNLMMVSQPKLQKKLKAQVKYQVEQESRLSTISSNNAKKNSPNTDKKLSDSFNGTVKDGEEDKTTQNGGSAFTNKAYYGHIIQALYS